VNGGVAEPEITRIGSGCERQMLEAGGAKRPQLGKLTGGPSGFPASSSGGTWAFD